MNTDFFNQMPQLLLFSVLIFVRLLFEDGIHFLEKSVDINDSWIWYVQVIQWMTVR